MDIKNNILDMKIMIIIFSFIIGVALLFFVIYSLENKNQEDSSPLTMTLSTSQSPKIDGPEVIYKNRNYIIQSEFYLSYFTAKDNAHNDITNRIKVTSDEYKGSANKTGRYDVTLSVTDNENRTSNHDFIIIVTNTIKPYIIIDNDHFILSPNNQMNKVDIISTLKEINAIPNHTYAFDTIFDNYTSNATSIGTFNHSFHLLSEAGEEYFFYLTFENIENDHYLINASPTFISSFISFITSWWWTLLLPVIITIGIIKK